MREEMGLCVEEVGRERDRVGGMDLHCNEKIKSILEIQHPGIVTLGRTFQCPYFQEHSA
jgi:hypothetical protein